MKLFIKSTLLLLALLLQQAAAQTTVPQDSPLGRANKNLVLLVSIDGFRNDYLERGITPNSGWAPNHGSRVYSPTTG
ncbi:MAG: hypothetical protein RLZZ481_2630 [Pseudomonadota bacterium]|jgi:predicted AlkP superfamily pyrophosphatase or phosphodiesterase